VSGYRLVTKPADLAQALDAARQASAVAVDTEAASFHRYVDRIYLIQVSTPDGTTILDPLALDDLSPLGDLLADERVEKVFHDADYDLRILDRDYGFRVRRVFDTRIGAHLAGEPAVGLAALLEKYCGVRLSKAHQKADWSRRPLPEGMLSYAAADTQHLLHLRAVLEQRLSAIGRLAWAREEFDRLEAVRWSGAADQDETYLRIKGARGLRPRQLAALRELARWREDRAAADDRAPFRVISNEALLAIARQLPTSSELLGKIPRAELPPVLASRHGPELLESVARALALTESELPVMERAPRPPRDVEREERLERLKAARNKVAEQLHLDPGVLCGRGVLEAVARARPPDHAALLNVPGVRRWQVDVLGDALLKAL
jgi:ribonuclease D